MSQGGNVYNFAYWSLIDELNEGAEKTESLLSLGCIYRVPKDLRKLNESAYTPRFIGIGPLHRGNKQLQTYYTFYLLFRVAQGIKGEMPVGEKMAQVLGECLKKIEARIVEAKKYYAEEVGVNDDKLSGMMVVDGCFILELLYISHCRRVEKSKEEEKCSTTKEGDSGNTKASSSSFSPPTEAGEGGNCGDREQDPISLDNNRKQDPILDNILIAAIVKHDLLLLENQIPFFVLEELFELTVANIQGENKVSLTEYVVSYFHDIMSPKGENSDSKNKTYCSSSDCILWVCGSTKKNEAEAPQKNEAEANHYYHILHFLHDFYIPDQERISIEKTAKKKFSQLEACASDLDHAGVKFVPLEGNNLFDINFREPERLCWSFRGAKFEIPTLHIHEPTLRNLIALEQSCPRVSPHYTLYAKLMDMLINSEEDVRVLKKAKVIHNYLGKDSDVANLFHNLCNDVVLGEFYFNDACQKASKYSKLPWPQFMGKLKGTYFASTWSRIGFCVAFIVFGMEIINFVRTFLK